MIHHISIPAENPQHVAQVLAQLIHGQFVPFPSHPGSYVAVAGDEHGTMIEVYPLCTALVPGADGAQVEFRANTYVNHFQPLHAALSVTVTQTQIEEIAAREGWRVLRCNRGPFEVIEFWIENRLLVELLTAEIAPQYLKFMHPQNLQQLLAGTEVNS